MLILVEPAYGIEGRTVSDPSAPGGVGREYTDNRAHGSDAIRRPVRGLTLTKESYAKISIQGTNIGNVELANSSEVKPISNYTFNFLLQNITETRTEKHQIISTFGPSYIYFFGEQPRNYTFQGILLRSENFRWEKEWWTNYQTVLRGSQAASRLTEVTIEYDESVVTGYMTTCMTSKDAMNPNLVQLSFTFFVTDHTYTGLSPYSKLISESGANVISDSATINSIDQLEFDGSLADIRRANILAASPGVGFVADLKRLAQTVEDFTDSVGNTLTKVKNWMYGRSLVLPAGFAGSDLLAGISRANFAEGSGANELVKQGLFDNIGATGVDPRSSRHRVLFNIRETIRGSAKEDNLIFSNKDEYIGHPGPELNTWTSALEIAEVDDLLLNTAAISNFAKFGIVPPTLISSNDVLAYQAEKNSIWTSLGQGLGRVTFGAVSIGAAFFTESENRKVNIAENPNYIQGSEELKARADVANEQATAATRKRLAAGGSNSPFANQTIIF